MGSNLSMAVAETVIDLRGVIRTSADGGRSKRLSITLTNGMLAHNEMYCTILAGRKAIEILTGSDNESHRSLAQARIDIQYRYGQ